MNEGYIQVYTGDGKGKTTAALGLGLRAVGRGYNVIMFQFLKGSESGELKSVLYLSGKYKIIRLAETKKFFFNLTREEKETLKKKLENELKQVYEVMANQACDVLILDEIMAALHGGLLTVEEICKLMDSKPSGMELILTGRSAPPEVLERADLVTEMRCVKHYMDKGVMARAGIEK
ncbi:MAG: cob(I)yrinic acid a,c-diamide adenosyltransferase [Firmicutes bacterium]|jgi:cob(I)alamin adenosyltransferase|nr:cob(I)yrinic acid a,c-diamide adenosyltransferase [Bacillota bacterium]